MLMDRYHQAIDDLLKKVRETQRETVIKVGNLVAETAEQNRKIYLNDICHAIENDVIQRGGGPIFLKRYEKKVTQLNPGDLLFVSSVSGRTKKVVDLAWDAMEKGVNVVAFTSLEYAQAVEPVHPSGKRLHEFVTIAVDNCAPAAEAMLDVEGIEAKFAAASGISSAYLLWSITSCAVEKMLADGYTPGILKSANFPGGFDYNDKIQEHYEQYGY